MLSYLEAIFFSVSICLFKVNTKNTRKRCEISPELTIHSLSCEERGFSGSDADRDAEL